MSPFVKAWPVALLLCGLAGCSGSQDHDIKDWLETRKATVKPRVQPIKEPLVFKPQAYVGAEEVDPFNRLKLMRVLTGDVAQPAVDISLLQQEQQRQKQDLEKYPLESMVMVGTIQKNGQTTALIHVNQEVHSIKQGDYLGQNYGQVVLIDEHHLQLREVVQNGAGDWVPKTTTLHLQEGTK